MKNVIKLDRRYKGYGTWTHRTDYPGAYEEDARAKIRLRFFEQRAFLTTQFGPGCFQWEAWALKKLGRPVPVWGFDEAGNIFLRDEALTTFILTEGRWE